jgi:hypothetical protein
MVFADICEPPPDPEPGTTGVCAFADDSSNGFAAFWLSLVFFADDFDDVSALRASRADDTALAAPRAGNMGNSNNAARVAADKLVHVHQQAPCHDEKPNKTRLSRIRSARQTRQ